MKDTQLTLLIETYVKAIYTEASLQALKETLLVSDEMREIFQAKLSEKHSNALDELRGQFGDEMMDKVVKNLDSNI